MPQRSVTRYVLQAQALSFDNSPRTDRLSVFQSHAGKVVERSWYQRSKHIFPASRWEVYDPDKDYGAYVSNLLVPTKVVEFKLILALFRISENRWFLIDDNRTGDNQMRSQPGLRALLFLSIELFTIVTMHTYLTVSIRFPI